MTTESHKPAHPHSRNSKSSWSWTKDTTIRISLALLIPGIWGLTLGAWNLRGSIEAYGSSIDRRLTNLERFNQHSWNYPMERETWNDASVLNPGFKIPDVSAIRKDHQNAYIPAPAPPLAGGIDPCDGEPVQ